MKERLIYISPDATSFTRKDITFLSNYYDVTTMQLPWGEKKMIPLNLIKQFFFLMGKIRGSRAAVVMFGGYWSFLPALLGKIFRTPVFIIPGGADCVSFPEYQYGSLRKPVLRKFIHWSYSLAERLLPVDESLVKSDNRYDPAVKITSQGILNFFPGLKTPFTIINNGFDHEYWKPEGSKPAPYVFTTVAKVSDHSRFMVKGIDMVIKAANGLPEHLFNVIGMDLKFAGTLKDLPGNIVIYEFLTSDQIKGILNTSRFYLQLSVSEGFPNSLCEAMLCECIPICSSAGGMPFIVKDTGLIIHHKDDSEFVDRIRELAYRGPDSLDDLGKKARHNIEHRFHIKRREDAFINLIGQS
ncbi:MAG: glycosyltransferase family 4 protein [Bacteroidales bacterium]|jgi:glycosyltransferase involved in cell wall biosynthesis|nr:glycosyltransferase family 4 protein [Bacteroidales bacterium]